MSSTRSMATPWLTVTANAEDPSDNGFTPATQWMDASRAKEARAVVRMRTRINDIDRTASS